MAGVAGGREEGRPPPTEVSEHGRRSVPAGQDQSLHQGSGVGESFGFVHFDRDGGWARLVIRSSESEKTSGNLVTQVFFFFLFVSLAVPAGRDAGEEVRQLCSCHPKSLAQTYRGPQVHPNERGR